MAASRVADAHLVNKAAAGLCPEYGWLHHRMASVFPSGRTFATIPATAFPWPVSIPIVDLMLFMVP